MEQKQLTLKSIVCTAAMAIIFVPLISFFISRFCYTKEINETVFLLVCITSFLIVLFCISLLFVFKLKELKNRNEREKNKTEYDRKKDWEEFQYNLHKTEYDRKKDWEEFQYNLHKDEKTEKQRYETIKSLIEKWDNKEIKAEIPLKKEIEELRKEFDKWKKNKDYQIIVEIATKLKKETPDKPQNDEITNNENDVES